MAIKSVLAPVLYIIIAGCAFLPPVTDNQGKVKEHVIIKYDYITIYDKDWKTKGYGKAQKQLHV